VTSGDLPPIAAWQHGAALTFVAIDIVTRAARSAVLMPVSLSKAIMVNCCGDALAAVTPVRLGGDPVRFVWFVRTGIAASVILAAFATETVVNTLVLVAGAVLLLVSMANVVWPLTKSFLHQAVTGSHLPITVATCALCTLLLFALARRHPTRLVWVVVFLREAWQAFRMQSRRALVPATAYSVLSMLARMAILPVLLARIPGIETGPLLVGSAAALYALLLSPTPGGLGAIEAGFFAGFGDAMDARHIAALLITWRLYAWVCSAAIGALLLLRERVASLRGR
jgi:uncharacterized membrane protein YbhN (UPF0104 family)